MRLGFSRIYLFTLITIFFLFVINKTVSEATSSGGIVELEEGSTENGAMRFLTENKIWIVIGVVGVLLLLAIIQMIYTIHRNKKSRPPPVSTKVCLCMMAGSCSYSSLFLYI